MIISDVTNIFENAFNNPPILSVLICHLPERSLLLQRLLIRLKPQIVGKPVEIIINDAPKGMTIGEKRNLLVGESHGKYLAFIDDDDLVSENYVSLILEAIKKRCDCIGIVGIYSKEGKKDWTFRHSITVSRWCKDVGRRIYFRTPNHLNPIKREFVLKCPFPKIQSGEDRAFSDSIRSLLRSETFIEEPIYYYYD